MVAEKNPYKFSDKLIPVSIYSYIIAGNQLCILLKSPLSGVALGTIKNSWYNHFIGGHSLNLCNAAELVGKYIKS